jgi:hypothetical protein
MTTPTRTKAVAGTPGQCRRKCPQGCRCCLENGAAHTLCICKEESCACHGRARYETVAPVAEMEMVT